jgi:hypothetical protein
MIRSNISHAGDALEREAELAGWAVTRGAPITIQTPSFTPLIQRQREEKKVPEKKKKEEEKKPPKLEAILKKVDDMIRVAREIPGGQYAADNLEYWKSKKGGTKKMPASAFQEEFIIEWLKGKPRRMFIRGAEKRLKSKELVSGGKAKMYWIDSLYAPEGHPLYYALGGFTIRSDVIVKATAFPPEEGGGFLVSFVSWTCKATDEYNWDKLKSAIIPFFGQIEDEELLVLERHGYGKGFKIESEPWAVTDPQCLQEVSIEIE